MYASVSLSSFPAFASYLLDIKEHNVIGCVSDSHNLGCITKGKPHKTTLSVSKIQKLQLTKALTHNWPCECGLMSILIYITYALFFGQFVFQLLFVHFVKPMSHRKWNPSAMAWVKSASLIVKIRQPDKKTIFVQHHLSN